MHCTWRVWHELDEETREMAARVIAAEADRFVGVAPPSRKFNNTEAESNAWNCQALAIAAVMFPNHPHAARWRETDRQWSVNALSVAADRQNDELIEGKPVREWVTTENIHGDFTIDNHGIVYPLYMWSSMHGLCQSALYHRIAGLEPPPTAYHHLRDLYDVYKRLQTWEGLPAHIKGLDKTRGKGRVCYWNRGKPVEVRGGAPGGYGRIEDRLGVRHIKAPRQFAPSEIIGEGELHIQMLPVINVGVP